MLGELADRIAAMEEDAFLAWAKESNRADLVRVKESVDRAALKKAAQLAEDGVVVIDGEVVPGASTWSDRSRRSPGCFC